MHLFYRNSLLCFLALMIPAIGNTADDRLYDDAAVVTMRKNKPCFSYPKNDEKLFGYHLIVSTNGSAGNEVWNIQQFNFDKKKLPEPNSPENCIEYSVFSPEAEVKRAAEKLLHDTPYRVFITVAEAPTGEQRYRHLRNFISNFCITSNEKGEPVLVEADFDKAWYCLKPGETKKRGFWGWLFGK